MENCTINYPKVLKEHFESARNCFDIQMKDNKSSATMRFLFCNENIPVVNWNVDINTLGCLKIWCIPARGLSHPNYMKMKVNKWNSTSRFLKFYLDSDNDLIITHDTLLSGSAEDAVQQAELLLHLVNRLVDDLSPEIMKAAWGHPDCEDLPFEDDDADDFDALDDDDIEAFEDL